MSESIQSISLPWWFWLWRQARSSQCQGRWVQWVKTHGDILSSLVKAPVKDFQNCFGKWREWQEKRVCIPISSRCLLEDARSAFLSFSPKPGQPEQEHDPRPELLPTASQQKSGEPLGDPLAALHSLRSGGDQMNKPLRNTAADSVRTTQETTEQLQNTIKITRKVHWFCSKTASTSLYNNCSLSLSNLVLELQGRWGQAVFRNQAVKTGAGWRDTLIMS